MDDQGASGGRGVAVGVGVGGMGVAVAVGVGGIGVGVEVAVAVGGIGVGVSVGVNVGVGGITVGVTVAVAVGGIGVGVTVAVGVGGMGVGDDCENATPAITSRTRDIIDTLKHFMPITSKNSVPPVIQSRPLLWFRSSNHERMSLKFDRYYHDWD